MDSGSLMRFGSLAFGDSVVVREIASNYTYVALSKAGVRKPKTTDAVWYVRRISADGTLTVPPVDSGGNADFTPSYACHDMSALSWYDPTS